MDAIFDALGNPYRRRLLDALRQRDGQTLSELEAVLPVTRFGVMKHLKVLEDAHLVVTRKIGREKFHYLNPVPIQQVSDRWISRYAAPLVRSMSDVQRQLEGGLPAMSATAPTHVYELYIKAPPQAVWEVLTDDARTPLWQKSNMACRADWREGGAISFLVDDHPVIVGELVEVDPPRKLVHTFSARWSAEVAADQPSRVTWEVQPVGENVCKLVLTHDDFGGETATSRQVSGGWPESLSRLKTLIETGEPLLVPSASAAA